MKAVLFASFLCVSCELPPGHHYTVYMDGFTVSQQQSIIDATDDWHIKIPGLTFDMIVGSCSGLHDREICMHPSTGQYMASIGCNIAWAGCTKVKSGPGSKGETAGFFGTDGGDSYLNIELIEASASPQMPNTLATVAEHEIGHAMGLLHHNANCLMNPILQNGYPTATDNDIAQWFYVRSQLPL